MRYTYSLNFNCVPEWRDDYLKYASLKKQIHALERAQFELRNGSNVDVQEKRTDINKLEGELVQAIEEDIKRVVAFYQGKKQGLTAQLNKVRGDVPVKAISTSTEQADKLGAVQGAVADSVRGVYALANDVADFLEMNWNGFQRVAGRYETVATVPDSAKAIKKSIESSFRFPLEQASLQKDMSACEELWLKLSATGSEVALSREEAIADLRRGLRERLAFERATVWQELVAAERKIAAIEPAPLPAAATGNKATPAAAHHGPSPWGQVISLVVAFGSMALLMAVPIFPVREVQNCLAMMVCLIVLWCSEALPLFITAALIPLLAVALRVLPNRTVKDASKEVFFYFFSHNILLLLGGFSLASALSKYGVTKAIASAVLKRSSRKPTYVVLTNMAICCFASMWISNVAGSVLCFGLLQPILRNLPHDSAFAKALILGIAYAANVGGLGSPIASPQSVIGNGILSEVDSAKAPGFATWLLISFPTMVIGVLTSWAVLVTVFKMPSKEIVLPESASVDKSPAKKRMQWTVSVIALITILLFCVSSLGAVKAVIGDGMGIMATFPLVAYFGIGALGKEDFNGFLWNVVMLAMGGSALGKCVELSGLLGAIGTIVMSQLQGFSGYTVILLFTFMVLIATSFISHTVGAVIFLPLVKTIGLDLGIPRPIIMAACFTCSAGMGLPISGFPNMNAVAQEDAQGRPFVNTNDFMKTGLVASVFFWAGIVFVGVPLMYLLCA